MTIKGYRPEKSYRHACPVCGHPAPTFAGYFRQHLKDGLLPFWFETYRKSQYCPGSGRPVEERDANAD